MTRRVHRWSRQSLSTTCLGYHVNWPIVVCLSLYCSIILIKILHVADDIWHVLFNYFNFNQTKTSIRSELYMKKKNEISSDHQQCFKLLFYGYWNCNDFFLSCALFVKQNWHRTIKFNTKFALGIMLRNRGTFNLKHNDNPMYWLRKHITKELCVFW